MFPRLSVLAALAVLLLGVGAASAAEKPNCDKRRGTTLAATSALRLYGIWDTKSRRDPARGLFACTYRDGKRYRLSNNVRTGGPAQFGVNGSVAYLIDYDRQADSSAKDFGDIYVTTGIWDARRKGFVGILRSLSVRYVDVAISPTGMLAAIANPDGRPPNDANGQPTSPRSEVVLYDPTGYTPATKKTPGGYPPWRTLASGAPGSFTNLAANAATLYWQQADGTHTAPFTYTPTP